MQIHDQEFSIQINQQGLRKLVDPLEAEVMEAIWSSDQQTFVVKDVFRMLHQEREISQAQLVIAMGKLVSRGLLQLVDTVGVANCYAPICTRAELFDATVGHVLEVLSREFPDEFNKSASAYISARTITGLE